MSHRLPAAIIVFLLTLLATPAFADVIYNNLTPNNLIATATRPESTGKFEIEAADDFLLTQSARINSASFTGLIVPSGAAAPSIGELVVEIYRVFPQDSALPGGGVDVGGTRVPTRVNSPSDVEFVGRDSAGGELTFTTSVVTASFTALNSVQPGGIHLFPNQTTGGNGPLTGQEVQFNVTFTTPIDLPPDHYFFVPQVAVSGGEFYWLSASRPITGTGTTPFAPDLQSWTRDANLDPDWLRVGTDIVGGSPAPTFNAAFRLDGTVPEPSTLLLIGAGITGFGVRLARRTRAAQ